MADRQLYQLTPKVPALTDVIGIQDAAGAIEQGQATLQTVKDLMFAGVGVPVAKKIVIRFSCISNLFSNQVVMESDFPGLSLVTINKPAVDKISITISQNLLFDTTKVNFQLNTNGTLFVRPAIAASNQVDLFMAQHDGTPPPSTLPSFSNYFITIFIYP